MVEKPTLWCEPVPTKKARGRLTYNAGQPAITIVDCTKLDNLTCGITKQACPFFEEAHTGIVTRDLAAGELTFNVNTREVSTPYRNDKLDPSETKILSKLAAQPGELCTIKQLYHELHPEDFLPATATGLIMAYISRLRTKLEGSPQERDPHHIPIIATQTDSQDVAKRGYFLVTKQLREKR